MGHLNLMAKRLNKMVKNPADDQRGHYNKEIFIKIPVSLAQGIIYLEILRKVLQKLWSFESYFLMKLSAAAG